VREQRDVVERSFPDWSMELVRVSASYFEAKETIADRLPFDISDAVRDKIFQITETVSRTVRL
jgi:hypothetical protein